MTDPGTPARADVSTRLEPPPRAIRRFKRQFGTRGDTKAIFAVVHTMIVIAWHVLHDNATYEDLGADFFDRRTDTQARQRQLVRQLEAVGNKITLEPAA